MLEAALRYVDEQGLDALSLHRLGAALGVKAMSLYNHIAGKDGLLDGIVELLWSEVEREQEVHEEWRETLRSLAWTVRAMLRRHPSAANLLMSRPTIPVPALRVLDVQLRSLRRTRITDERSADILSAVLGYAFGATLSQQCWMWASGGQGQEGEIQRLRRISSALPKDAPDHLMKVGLTMWAGCDIDAPFELGLDLMLRSLDEME